MRIVLFIFILSVFKIASALPSYDTPLEKYKDNGCISEIPRKLNNLSSFVGNYKVDIIALDNSAETWNEHCDDYQLFIRDMRTMWNKCNLLNDSQINCGGIIYAEFGKFFFLSDKNILQEYIFINSETGLRGWYLGEEYPIAELPIQNNCLQISLDNNNENMFSCYEPSSEINFGEINCSRSQWGMWMYDTVTYEYSYLNSTRKVIEKADLSKMPEECRYE